jgi:predicted ArsR family transcriptional regulator
VYSVHPSAESRWGVVGPYERLSVLLTEMLRTGDTAVEVGRRAGLRQRLGARGVPDPVALVFSGMQQHGFDPDMRRRGDRVELILRSCPFATAALADPDTVCAIHLGFANGLADLTAGRIVVDELVPRDPRRAGCRLTLNLTEQDEGG